MDCTITIHYSPAPSDLWEAFEMSEAGICVAAWEAEDAAALMAEIAKYLESRVEG